MRYVVFTLLLFCLVSEVSAKVIRRSDNKPEWVRRGEAGLNNQRSNESYYFKIIRNAGADLSMLQQQKTGALASFIGQYNQISGNATTDIKEMRGDTRRSSHAFTLSFTNESRTDIFYARFVDEYWEYVDYPDGSLGYEYYALFAVSRHPSEPMFDDFAFTTNYGAGAVARSLIPGWGQIYKGSTAKGLCIMGGEALCVAGIILSESTRADYVRKMKEEPKFAKEYNNKANNWETGRNVCIGAAAALYIYNLIDAAASKGAKRIVVRRNPAVRFSMAPTLTESGVGLGFALNF